MCLGSQNLRNLNSKATMQRKNNSAKQLISLSAQITFNLASLWTPHSRKRFVENKQATRPKCAPSFVSDPHVPLCHMYDFTDLSDVLCCFKDRLAVQLISSSLGPSVTDMSLSVMSRQLGECEGLKSEGVGWYMTTLVGFIFRCRDISGQGLVHHMLRSNWGLEINFLIDTSVSCFMMKLPTFRKKNKLYFYISGESGNCRFAEKFVFTKGKVEFIHWSHTMERVFASADTLKLSFIFLTSFGWSFDSCLVWGHRPAADMYGHSSVCCLNSFSCKGQHHMHRFWGAPNCQLLTACNEDQNVLIRSPSFTLHDTDLCTHMKLQRLVGYSGDQHHIPQFGGFLHREWLIGNRGLLEWQTKPRCFLFINHTGKAVLLCGVAT